MGAGYGNHDATSPADAKADAAGQKPPAGGQDRPGVERGGSRDQSGSGAADGSGRTPSEDEGSQTGRKQAAATNLDDRRDAPAPDAR